MTMAPDQIVEWIPIDRIQVLNPRSRDRQTFREIVDNIAQIGLKRPITVTRRSSSDGLAYDLVCGQGRLEACMALGQTDVPAIVIVADLEQCLVASLVENCARRRHNAGDLLQDITRMRSAGQTNADIARKIGMSVDYVRDIADLIDRGETRLLRAVDAGTIPLSVAIDIAQASDHMIQRALQDAYDAKLLRGSRLLAAKKLVEARRRRGPSLARETPISSSDLVREFEADVGRKRDMIHRGNAARDRMMLVVEALRRLLADERFLPLIEAECLSSLPASISRRLPLPATVPR
ncbi:MAG: chromosome partitioning protein ParB [Rhizorhabdus sp.]|nr:chromosome partitioning protein ParB [Rhizorhabdus sp.]